MENKKRIRRDFAPLSVSVAIFCDSAYSPVTQVYNGATGEYEPNRSLSPTVIRPVIYAHAVDGSWPTPRANASLANMKWYIDGVDITTIAAWTGLYSIEASGDNRGSITIMKNILPGSNVSLRFEASLVDNRLGVTLPIKTDLVYLSTIDKGEDAYTMSISEKNIRYNPFLDKLHLYDYKVAHGLISASSAAEAAARDGNEYQRTIPFKLYKGSTQVTSGFTVKLYKVNSVSSITEYTPSNHPEIVSISTSAIVLDLRMIEKLDFIIKAFISNVEVASCQFSVIRLYPTFKCTPVNETGILPNQIERYDVAQVESESKIIECPGHVLKIVWKTDSLTISNMEHNEGGSTVFDLRKTGIGTDYTNDWLDVYTDAIQKDIHKVATDGSDTWVDESGNILIFN